MESVEAFWGSSNEVLLTGDLRQKLSAEWQKYYAANLWRIRTPRADETYQSGLAADQHIQNIESLLMDAIGNNGMDKEEVFEICRVVLTDVLAAVGVSAAGYESTLFCLFERVDILISE